MRFGTRAFLHGPPGLWDSDWVDVPSSAVSAVTLHSWSSWFKWVAFLGTLHCPAGGVDLGVGGISSC